MPKTKRIQELLRRYHSGLATEAETKEMFALLAQHESIFSDEMQSLFLEPAHDGSADYNRAQWQDMLKQIELKTTAVKRIHTIRWAAAASALLIVSLLGYFAFKNERASVTSSIVKKEQVITAGTDKAILILGNGKRIELSDQQQISDDGLTIQNVNNELIYENLGIVTTNTMQTPRGGQYKLQLADGTKIWLNAASSITYPTAFDGKQRIVEVKGEAYFEVAPDKSKPFIINVEGTSVEVLGTRFNINAYDNEPVMQTSLIDGAVRIGNKTLQPGEAWIGGKIVPAELSKALAWKNGLFDFNGATVEELMRQLERWYDVRVIYKNKIPSDLIFRGEMYRNVDFDMVLEFLRKMGVKVEQQEKTLIVY